MAVVSVTPDVTVISLAQSDSDNGTWDKANTSQTPTQEDNSVWNGTINQSNQSSNNVQGVEFEDDATIDFTTPKVVLAKLIMTTPGTIDVSIAKGFWYEVGEGVNGGTGTYFYYLSGLYAGEYPILNSWRVIAIDPNEVAWRDEVGGTVTLSTIDYYAIIADTDSSAKTDNIVHARLDYLTNGTGATLVGGDSTDPDGTLDDFIADDFEDTAERYGVVLPGEAETIVNGVLTIGTATATVYNDANRILVFPNHLVGEGFSGIDIGMSNASNDINLTSYVMKGLGNATVTKFFDSELEVNGTTEVITLVAHGFNTGDLVTYTNDGTTNITGLTTGTQYFLNALTVDTLALYAIGATVGRQNAFSDTTRVGLTAFSAGTGTNHSLTRDPDTRFDYEVTGTTGIGHTLSACTIDGARIVTFTSSAAMTGGFILRTGSIVLGGGTMTEVIITTPTLEEGDALYDLTATALGTDLTTMDITSGDDGHFVRVTAVGTAAWDHTLSGYWEPAAGGWNFAADQAFTSEQVNMNAAHGFTTGDAVYYNDEGGTPVTGLTNGNKYYVDVIDTDTVTLHLSKAAAVASTNAVDLTTSGAETHSLYSANAAIFNDTSSGTLTINVESGTSVPSFRNADGATTVVNNAVDVVINGVTEGAAIKVIANETVGTVTVGDVLGEGLADSTGTFAFAIDYETAFNPSGLDVIIRARQQGLPNYCLYDDNGTFTDQTTEANSAADDDMILVKLDGVEDEDFVYFGHAEQFGRLKLDISTAGVGTYEVEPQYWTGSIWTAPTPFIDGTDFFTVAGENTISWNIHGDWTTRTVDSKGPVYWFRFRYIENAISTAPLGRKCKLDVTRYLPFVQNNTITSSGLTVTASWAEDTISIF